MIWFFRHLVKKYFAKGKENSKMVQDQKNLVSALS